MCNLLIHFKDYDEGNWFYSNIMTHIIGFRKNETQLFTIEHEKTHKKLLEYVNYGLSIMRQKNQKNYQI